MDKKKYIYIGIGVIILIIILVLLFSRSKGSSVDSTLDYGNKETVLDVVPIQDENAIAGSKYFDFKVNSEVQDQRIYYEVIITPSENNAINTAYIKTYLTDQANNRISGIVPFNSLSNSEAGGKILYRGLASKTETKDFRLRMWLSSDYQGPLSSAFDFDLSLNAYYVEDNFKIDAAAPIELLATTGNVLTGERVTTTIIPGDDGVINCSSSSEVVASCSIVDKTLYVTGITEGVATITVTLSSGKIYSLPGTVSYNVTVTTSKTPTTLSLEEESGMAFVEMVKDVQIITNGDGELFCASSDESVVTCAINEKTLKINGIKEGMANVTVGQREGNATLAATDVIYRVEVKVPAATTIKNLPELETVPYGKVYTGANPNNYVWFNNEQWRIIGVYGDNIKIIRDAQYSAGEIYNPKGSGNAWDGSQLQNYLYSNYETIISDENSRKMVLEDATWNIGATVPQIVASSAYLDATQAEWKGKIGLIATYEYQHAANKNCWIKKGDTYKNSCGEENWLYSTVTNGNGDGGAWTMTPDDTDNRVLRVHPKMFVDDNPVDSVCGVSPVVYLKKDVSITGGNGGVGEANSYKLGL